MQDLFINIQKEKILPCISGKIKYNKRKYVKELGK